MASNAENVSIWWRHHVAQSIETKPRQATTKHDIGMYCILLDHVSDKQAAVHISKGLWDNDADISPIRLRKKKPMIRPDHNRS